MKRASTLIVPLLASIALAWAMTAQAASHREAPLIALDPPADNTDVYAFVSYDAANIARAPADRRVTFILNVNPGQDPSDGPNYFNFDDQVRIGEPAAQVDAAAVDLRRQAVLDGVLHQRLQQHAGDHGIQR